MLSSSDLHDGLQRRTRQRLLDGEPLSCREDADHDGGAGLECLRDLTLDSTADLVAGELAHDASGHRTHGHRGEQWGREQAHEDPHATAPARTLAAHVVTGVPHGDLAVGVLGHQDHPAAADLFALHLLHERVELGLSGLRVRVAGHQQHQGVTHVRPFRLTCGSRGPTCQSAVLTTRVAHPLRGNALRRTFPGVASGVGSRVAPISSAGWSAGSVPGLGMDFCLPRGIVTMWWGPPGGLSRRCGLPGGSNAHLRDRPARQVCNFVTKTVGVGVAGAVVGRWRGLLPNPWPSLHMRRGTRQAESLFSCVGVAGFEPTTSSSRTKRATKLRHTPHS